jgi:hypothetical protein
MSQFQFPDEYNLESFGGQPNQPVAPPPKAGRSRSFYILLGCLGVSLCCVGFCVACLGLSFLMVREPTGITSAWGVYMTGGNYQFAELVTCQGSQAADYTQELGDQGVEFRDFGTPVEAGENAASATATIVVEGELQDWSATFYVLDGGMVGRCIDRIEVDGQTPESPAL